MDMKAVLPAPLNRLTTGLGVDLGSESIGSSVGVSCVDWEHAVSKREMIMIISVMRWDEIYIFNLKTLKVSKTFRVLLVIVFWW